MFRNGLEPWHIILVVVVFILLFGYKKLPEAARGLGKSLRILKSETRAMRDDHSSETTSEDGSGTARPGALGSPQAPAAERAAEQPKDERRTA
ncbi:MULTISPECIES: Sec-independent protein translocase subunit TatA [Streptomycetaceae]|uniref:Sec-independent protein translocase protein TatA n=1 Tax=Streptantibioticus cattleyicolor (strain ATCC 35852 / DSM 46488 / JCM 4925 / NBRC 14057 / NRRL 8057) TaxID=1003195 RepID=F8K3A9_STREN|nr:MULTISPECIES: Sec-independent protein translocase subunit TatA [Streptomycetaceae]AEW95020.1 hypothetical protein SCATT_26490 [Streptantibioticus cattleyicolor NRRL 8057 = DSM 46488]MYS59621.1 twin-arginine translocase TatA/TatE family subunit [Streptomyces sp. SID5468]CCB75373.1 Sec-independent protein translocase protein tatA/E homolog [Streptantibioticus cattleyicolor NRRL 8057 = DSM 46488]